MTRAALFIILLLASCGPRKLKAVVDIGACTGDRTTTVDGRIVKYELGKGDPRCHGQK